MSTRRTLLAAAGAAVLTVPPRRGGIAPAKPHPDAALLDLCARLRVMQAEWQRLWDATPDTPDGGPADQAFDDYFAHVWPGVDLSDPRIRKPGAMDQAARLVTLRATTREGLAAKAAAILAMEQAQIYDGGDSRDDWHDMLLSVLQDAAGAAYVPVGADACPSPEIASAVATALA